MNQKQIIKLLKKKQIPYHVYEELPHTYCKMCSMKNKRYGDGTTLCHECDLHHDNPDIFDEVHHKILDRDTLQDIPAFYSYIRD